VIYRIHEMLFLDVQRVLHQFGAWTYVHDAYPPVTVIEVHRLIDLLARLHAAQLAADAEFDVPSEAGHWLANGHRMANAFRWGDHHVLVLAHDVDLDRQVEEPDPPAYEVWQAHFTGVES